MKKVLFIFVFVPLFILGGCIDYLVPSTWNYRITVEIETPEGIKTASAVRHVRARLNPETLPEATLISHGFSGEAVVVDLGAQHGVIFAVLGPDPYRDVYNAFPHSRRNPKEFVHYYRDLEAGTKASLPEDEWPRLVMFKDMNDPKSVMLVRGYEYGKNSKKTIVDNMEELFGEGFSIKNISIEMTDDRVTKTVDRYLPWLHIIREKRSRLNGKTGAMSTNQLADNLGSGSFQIK